MSEVRDRAGGVGRRLHVVILGDWLSFPHGMATTSRARLIARALSEEGADVKVICMQATEHPSRLENTQVRGEYHGIGFEYTSGTTVRHDRFLARRLIEAWGWAHGTLRLVQLSRQGQLDVVLLWFWAPRPVGRLFFFLLLLRLLKTPVVRNIDESPWALEPDRSLLERLWSPLAGTSGAVTISAELRDWAARDRRGKLRRHVLEVPILVDAYEREPSPYPATKPLVVFAGGAAYRQTIRFVCTAMEQVWRSHPDCRLLITGAARGDPYAAWLHEEVRHEKYAGRIELAGYLSRSELLELYERAHVLPIPLFDDLRSRARFPTKIGEYLAAARPVVTNDVGEIPRYFTDGVDAAVLAPGDPIVFGEAIGRLLSDPDLAARMGRRGRDLAEARFHYTHYSGDLLRWILGVVRDPRSYR